MEKNRVDLAWLNNNSSATLGANSLNCCTFAPTNQQLLGDDNMALAISHISVLTGKVAERYERKAENNEKYMRGSQYNPEAFEIVCRREENTGKYYDSLKK